MAKEYIERGALLEDMATTILPRDAQKLYLAMRGKVRNAPAADVVEVVRCRDCVHMVKTCWNVLCAKRVYSDDYSVKVLTPTKLDNFCNYGAKMDGKVLPHKFLGKSQDGECGVEILDGKDGEG